jgi:hypothetical protein
VELFEFFEHYSASLVDGMHLVLIGTPHVEIPKHPKIHHLGFVEDQDKYDAMAAAELLIMPSYLESLSMVALEAWAMGKPVLANAKCDVLQGQCLRSNAGLFYQNYAEFAETLRAIDTSPSLQAALGRNGRMFFERHYAWPVIEQKYVDMLQQLAKDTPAKTMESMPGWFSRRRRTQRPADEIVNALPVGPYRDARTDARPPRSEARAPRPEVRQRSQARPEQHRHPGRPEQPRPPQQRTDGPRPQEGREAAPRNEPRRDGQRRDDQRRDPRRNGRHHRRGRRPAGGQK